MFSIAPGKGLVCSWSEHKQEESLEETLLKDIAEGQHPWLSGLSVGNVENTLLLHGMES